MSLISRACKTVRFARGLARTYSSLPDINPNALIVERTKAPKQKTPYEQLMFGKEFSDHMLQIDWSSDEGWGAPTIGPFESFKIHPAATCLHYAMECFEGMKAYKDKAGRTRMFRPDMNMKRLHSSATRLAMPSFEQEALLACIKRLLRVDKDWIPQRRGYSLYIRPTMIGTQPSLGVGPSNNAKVFVICSPVGPYYKSGFAPVGLLADTRFVRAWPGGVGNTKCGGNYAPGVIPQVEAAKKGYSQILWLYGPTFEVTEVGTMNLFMFVRSKDGEPELVTPPLDGTILPGVTRDSFLALARQWGEFRVSERKFTMHDVIEAVQEKRMIEMFGAGTACIVSPISKIGFQGVDYEIPLELGSSGKLAKRFNDTIMDIQYGEVESEWSVVVD